MALSSSSPPEAVLPYQAAPSASASPTRPVCRTLSQRSMRCVIRARISWDLRIPNVFVRTTWAKTRGYCIGTFQFITTDKNELIHKTMSVTCSVSLIFSDDSKQYTPTTTANSNRLIELLKNKKKDVNIKYNMGEY